MTNPAISIKQRLLNLSRSEAVDYQQLLERFAMGRLLWRLVHSGRTFVLKGAQLFSVWQAMPHRPTRDLDLLGFGRRSGAFSGTCWLRRLIRRMGLSGRS